MSVDKISAAAIIMTAVCSVLLFSCEKDTNQTASPQPPPVQVSGTISKPAKTLPVKDLQTPSTSLPKAEKIARTVVSPKSKSESLSPAPAPEKKQLSGPDRVMNASKGKYDPKGKIDPFLPLVRTEKETPAKKDKAPEGPKRMLTPLEKVDLSQLKLVAVVIMKNKKLALVEEASGKGFEVGIGTYIGKNSGRVDRINQSSIVVKETVKDYKGKTMDRFREMKLHKRDNKE